MIRINGETLESDRIPLLLYLKEHGYDPRRIAVECNESIIPKARYEEVILQDGDVVEIVSFVGGG